MVPFITPTINLNGTSRDDLIEPRRKAFDHLQAAIDALRSAAPNGRDYPGEPERCLKDRDEHWRRLGQLQALADRLLHEAVLIKGDC